MTMTTKEQAKGARTEETAANGAQAEYCGECGNALESGKCNDKVCKYYGQRPPDVMTALDRT